MLPSMSRTVTSPIRRSWILRLLILVLRAFSQKRFLPNDRLRLLGFQCAMAKEIEGGHWSALSQSEDLSASRCGSELVASRIGNLKGFYRWRSLDYCRQGLQ